MKRKDIIAAAESGKLISYDCLYPYRHTVAAYFKAYYCCSPVFMVTFLSNNSCIGYIVSEEEFNEAIDEALQAEKLTVEEYDQEKEIISANSFYL